MVCGDVVVPSARAEMLAPETCNALREQRREFVSRGVGDRLKKGAEWASLNLDQEQIGEVAAFLQIIEKIRFRCPASKADAKSRFGLLGNIPLPVRNSRRVKSSQTSGQGG